MADRHLPEHAFETVPPDRAPVLRAMVRAAQETPLGWRHYPHSATDYLTDLWGLWTAGTAGGAVARPDLFPERGSVLLFLAAYGRPRRILRAMLRAAQETPLGWRHYPHSATDYLTDLWGLWTAGTTVEEGE